MTYEDFRPPTEWERKLLYRLTEQQFKGRAETVQQLDTIRVKQIENLGPVCSLELRVCSPVLLPIVSGPVAEASYLDSDASEWKLGEPPRVRILLHAWDRKLVHLEVYKDDFSPILKRPTLEELELATIFPEQES